MSQDRALWHILTEFSEEDKAAIDYLFRQVAVDGMRVLEVGSWIGTSTKILARKVIDYNGLVYVVDHWQGNEGIVPHQIANKIDIYTVFKYNLIVDGLWEVVCPLVMDSAMASSIIRDETFDLVFIDADHQYEPVKADIQGWLPKVKKGGILCGHDYGISHPGLKKAVNELLPDFELMDIGSIWYYRRVD